MATNVTVIGNLTGDPELKYTPDGTPVANFSIAETTRIPDGNGGWTDGNTTFFRAAAWKDLAEHVNDTLRKGMRVLVVGQLQNREYVRDDGTKGTSLDLKVTEIGPSLKWATAQVTKATGNGGGNANFGPGSIQNQGQGGWGGAPQQQAQQPQQGGWGGQQQPAAAGGWGGQQAEAPF